MEISMRKILTIAVVSAVAIAGAHSAGAQKCGQAMEVRGDTPHEVIAKMVVDQMFNDIVLTESQQSKAVAIVTTAVEASFKLDPKSPDYKKEWTAVGAKRNEDLMALLTTDADKAKLSACIKQMDRPARSGGL
jgi:hypothetical protein